VERRAATSKKRTLRGLAKGVTGEAKSIASRKAHRRRCDGRRLRLAIGADAKSGGRNRVAAAKTSAAKTLKMAKNIFGIAGFIKQPRMALSLGLSSTSLLGGAAL